MPLVPHPLDLPYEEYIEAVTADPNLRPKPDDYKRKAVVTQGGGVGKESQAKVMNESFTKNAKKTIAKVLICNGIVEGPFPKKFADTPEGRLEEIQHLAELQKQREKYFGNQTTWDRDTARGIQECLLLLGKGRIAIPQAITDAMRDENGNMIEGPRPTIYRAVGPIMNEMKWYKYYINLLHVNMGGIEQWARIEKILWETHEQASQAWQGYKQGQTLDREAKKEANSEIVPTISTATDTADEPSSLLLSLAAAAEVHAPLMAATTNGSSTSDSNGDAPPLVWPRDDMQKGTDFPASSWNSALPPQYTGNNGGAPTLLAFPGDGATSNQKRGSSSMEEEQKPAAKQKLESDRANFYSGRSVPGVPEFRNRSEIYLNWCKGDGIDTTFLEFLFVYKDEDAVGPNLYKQWCEKSNFFVSPRVIKFFDDIMTEEEGEGSST